MKIRKQTRISWDEYFMQMALLISQRATCPRKQVGSVLVKDNRVVATGYNGAPKKTPQCDEIGCLIEDNHCIRVIHSEVNTLLQAGEKAAGAILYTTVLPCQNCFKLLIQSGIQKIYYIEDYNRSSVNYWIKLNKIKVIKWKKK